MFGDVFLSKLFVRASRRISAMEQMCILVQEVTFGIYGLVSWYCLSFVLTQLSQADGFKTLDHPCPAFPNVDFVRGKQDLGEYTEEDYGGGAYFEVGYEYAS